MIEKIWNNFYNSVIFEDRYKYIFEGLFNTITMAIFAGFFVIVVDDGKDETDYYSDYTGKYGHCYGIE